MKKCKRCLNANADDALVCTNCGMEFPVAEPAVDPAPVAAPAPEPVVEPEPAAAPAPEPAPAAAPANLSDLDARREAAVRAAARARAEAEAAQAEADRAKAEAEKAAADARAAHAAQVAAAASAAAGAYATASAENAGAESSANGIPDPIPVSNPQGATSDGILTMAWKDVRQSPGWLGKAALLALINFVPILNFVVMGYSMRWGRTASYRTGDNLPPVKINGDYFKIGFFAWVIAAIWGCVLSLISSVPVVGILGIVLMVFAYPFCYLCIQRLNLLNSFAAAFDFQNVYQKYRRNLGGALAVFWLPGLLVTALVLAVVFAITIVFGLSIAGLSVGNVLFASLGVVGVLVSIVALYVIFVACAVATLVIYRAYGYWTARFAPEWIQEAYRAANMTPGGQTNRM